MTLYPLLFKHVLRRLPAEFAHALATRSLWALGVSRPVLAVVRRAVGRPGPELRVRTMGLTFDSPLGVGAGMDKHATCFEGLSALGFGFVEVGTITAMSQRGNAKPRVWRLVEDRALLNAMGFPNPGADRAAARLRRRSSTSIIGVNVGKSKATPLDDAAADYRTSVARVAAPADFIVLNVSSPNTAGLRQLQAVEHLRALHDVVLAELAARRLSRPVLIKLAPDLSDEEIDAVAEFAVERRVDGLIAVNTTTSREGLRASPEVLANPGGISGAPLKGRAVAVLRRLRARVGDQVALVSVGGVEDADDVWERVLAGATLVQGHTGFVYGGPLWASRINDELAVRVRRAGAGTIQELVGRGGPERSAAEPITTASI